MFEEKVECLHERSERASEKRKWVVEEINGIEC